MLLLIDPLYLTVVHKIEKIWILQFLTMAKMAYMDISIIYVPPCPLSLYSQWHQLYYYIYWFICIVCLFTMIKQHLCINNTIIICFSSFQTKMNGMGKMYSFYEQYWITQVLIMIQCCHLILLLNLFYARKKKYMWKIFQTYNRI